MAIDFDKMMSNMGLDKSTSTKPTSAKPSGGGIDFNRMMSNLGLDNKPAATPPPTGPIYDYAILAGVKKPPVTQSLPANLNQSRQVMQSVPNQSIAPLSEPPEFKIPTPYNIWNLQNFEKLMDYAWRGARTASTAAASPLAQGLNIVTGMKVKPSDIAQGDLDRMKNILTGKESPEQGMRDLAQTYLNTYSNKPKSWDDVRVRDLGVVAAIGAANYLGDFMFDAPIGGMLSKFKNTVKFKKVGQLEQILPEGMTAIDDANIFRRGTPTEISVGEAGNMKVSFEPSAAGTKIRVKGYVRRGWNPEEAVALKESFEQSSGLPSVITREGTDVVITPQLPQATTQAATVARLVRPAVPAVAQVGASHTPIKQAGETPLKVPTNKGIYNTAKIFKGEYNGKPYTTDVYLIEFEDLAVSTRANVIRDGAPSSDMIQTLVDQTKGGVSLSSPDKTTKLRGDIALGFPDQKVYLNSKYYNYLAKKYPNLRLIMADPIKPIAVYDGEQLKGLVQPLNPSEFGKSNWQPIKKVETVAQVGDNSLIEKALSSPQPTPTRAPISSEASTGSQKIGTFESVAPADASPEVFKLHERVMELGKKFSPTISESRYMPHGAAGVRWGDTGNVSTKGLNDLAVIAHESAHSIDTASVVTDAIINSKGFSVLRKQLTEVYVTHYVGGKPTHKLKTRVREGYATLVQKYIETPQQITQQYPELVSLFLKPGGRFYNDSVGELITESQSIIGEYQNLDALDRYGAHITDTLQEVDKKQWLSAYDQAMENFSDSLTPFIKLDKKLTNVSRLLLNYSGNVISQNVKGSYNIDRSKNDSYLGWRDGELKIIHDFNWSSLVESVGSENLNKFGWWLAARDQHFRFEEIDNMIQEINSKQEEISKMMLSAASDESAIMTAQIEVGELTKKYNDALAIQNKESTTQSEATTAYEAGKELFAEQAEMFDTLTGEDVNFLNETGLITDEQMSRFGGKGYAPRRRDIVNEIVGGDDTPAVINTGKSKVSFTISRKGSSKAIINPFAQAINNHIEATRKGMKQLIRNEIGNLGNQATFPDLIQRVTLQTIVDKKTGIITFPQERDPNIVMARIDGKRVPFEIDAKISEIINELFTPQSMGAISKTALFFARTFTKGTTGIISSFTLKNPVIDSMSALAQTQTNYIPIISQIKNIQKILANRTGPEAHYMMEYMTIVGNDHTSMGIYSKTPEEQLKWIKGESSKLEKLGEVIESGINILTIPTQISEIATRSMEYVNARLLGDSVMDALDKAATVSATFAYRPRLFGSKGLQTYSMTLPYFRASLQVLATTAKTFNRGPKSRQRFLFVLAAVVGAQVAATYYLFSQATEEQKNIYKGLYGKELGANLYFPKADGKTLGRIPLPSQMGWIGAIINMGTLEMMGEADYKPSDYMDSATSFIPQQFNITQPSAMLAGLLSKPFDIPIGLMTNTKFFPKVMPIESQTQKRKVPEERKTEGTSPGAIWIGKKLKLSPIQIDYLITGTFGRAAGAPLGKKSYWDFLSPFHQNDYFTSSRLVQDYWEKKSVNDKEYTTMKQMPGKYTGDKLANILVLHSQLKTIDKLLDVYSDIDPEKSPEAALKMKNAILSQIEKLK